MNSHRLLVAVATCAAAFTPPAQTASVSATFSVQVTLYSSCIFNTGPGNVALSYTAFQSTAASASTTMQAQCTSDLPYQLSLSSTNTNTLSVTGSAASDTTIASAPLAVQLMSNVGNVSFSSAGNALSSGSETIPLTQISVSSSNNALPHPTFGAAASSLAPSAGSKVINASTNWTYSYSHQGSTAPVGAGSFSTVITYTAAKL